MYRKWILLLCCFFLLCSSVVTAEDVELVDDISFDPLPMDFSPGPVPNEANFTIVEDGVSTYEDPTISVRMERIVYEVSGGDICNVARVKIKDPSQLRTALSSSYKQGQKSMRTDRISTIAKKNNAIVAIGGDYFYNEDKGVEIRQGETLRATFKTSVKSDLLAIDREGNFHIILEQDREELKRIVQSDVGVMDVFEFGPALIVDGKLRDLPSKYKYNIFGQEPRCAIGQIGPLEYLLVMVDGRRSNSNGMTCKALAQFMLEQGCIQAYNLDGGNSALLFFHNENYSNKTVKAERSVSDIIYFATAVPSD